MQQSMMDFLARPAPVINAIEARDRGIALALDNADAANEKWSDKALQFLRLYPSHEFQTEQVRAWATEQGLPVPPNARAWGGVIARARRMNLIVSTGYKNVSNPLAHGTPAAVWQKVKV